MIKNIKLAVLSLAVIGGTLTSCRSHDFGDDYNKDVYGIYKSDYKSLLAGAIQNFGTNGGDESTMYQMMPNLFVQHWAQVTYTTEQCYGDTPGAWSRFYVNQLQNLNTVIKAYATPTPDMLKEGSAENMIGVSKIMKSIIMKRVTDTYGDAPYTEANKVNEDVYLPKYDKQALIYQSIINELKSGRDLLNTGSLAPSGDVLYAGNVTRWKKLANSVILQAALELKGTSLESWAAAEFNSALTNSAGVITTVADEAWFQVSPSTTFPNPYAGFRAADYKISRQLVESMKGTQTGANAAFNRTSNRVADPRLVLYAGSASAIGLPYGYNTADLGAAGYSATSAVTVSARFRSNNSAMGLMTSGYTYLNRATGAAYGWSSESVSSMLTLGIQRNYEMLDAKYGSGSSFGGTTIAGTVGMNNYITNRVADLATAGNLRVIFEEKWIALFMNGFDAWTEWRKSTNLPGVTNGYPSLLPAPSALNGGVVPRRIAYPQEEASFNNANYLQGVSSLSPAVDKNTSKVWWNQ